MSHEDADARYRAYHAAESARLKLAPTTDQAFEEWSWKPFCKLRDFVRETIEEGSSLLRWYI